MSNKELLLLAAKGASSALGGSLEEGPDGYLVQLPGDEPAITLNPANDAAGMAPLHRMTELVRRGVGRVYLVSVPFAEAEQIVGDRASYLIVRFEATWHSAVPSSHRFGLAVPLVGGDVRPLTSADCAALAEVVRESNDRVESAIVESSWERLLIGAEREVAVGTEEVKAKLMSLQSRRRREIEAVFRARQMSLEDYSGEGDEAASAALLERERRAALDHADAYYDPNRLTVELRVTLALVVHPRALRRRRRSE
jgi:hypothetical protein